MASVYFGEALGEYGFGKGHPFGHDRLFAFWKETCRQGLNKKIHVAAPEQCNEADIVRFHTRKYVSEVKRRSSSGEGHLDGGDTPAFKGMFEASSYVIGSGLHGLQQIVEGVHRRVFVPIAGLHHARRDGAAGFCVFNDAGIMIEVLRQRFGIQRIAYVDIDAHHGDGVFYAFEDDPEVIFADIHEDGRFLYPGTGFEEETGIGPAAGSKLNIPLLPGADDDAFFSVWPRIEEFVREHRPEFIILQAGADSIAGDPITHMAFTPEAHGHAAKRLCRIADEYCDGRIIAMGGGGYNRSNVALGWNQVVRALLE